MLNAAESFCRRPRTEQPALAMTAQQSGRKMAFRNFITNDTSMNLYGQTVFLVLLRRYGVFVSMRQPLPRLYLSGRVARWFLLFPDSRTILRRQNSDRGSTLVHALAWTALFNRTCGLGDAGGTRCAGPRPFCRSPARHWPTSAKLSSRRSPVLSSPVRRLGSGDSAAH